MMISLVRNKESMIFLKSTLGKDLPTASITLCKHQACRYRCASEVKHIGIEKNSAYVVCLYPR
jgi:hypothetical protein